MAPHCAKYAQDESRATCHNHRMRRSLWCVIGLLSLANAAACSNSETEPSSPVAPSSTADASPADTGSTPVHEAPLSLARCGGEQREPVSITDTIAKINALAPANGPCVVASLPRPLKVVATMGSLSAQPADGAKSPRFFFLLPKLVVSAVPSGAGSEVLEFGEWVGETRTIKGELALPVNEAVATDAPLTRVLDSMAEGTACRSCHRDEIRHDTIPNAFVSMAFRPEPGQGVLLADLQKLHDTCTAEKDTSARCDMFHALFDFGEVQQGAFATKVETFLIH